MTLDNLTLGELNTLLTMKPTTSPATGPVPTPGRYVVVVDRGWIFAGDASRTDDGYIRLDRAVHVFKWSGIGFAKMLTEWSSSAVDLRPCDPVELPEDSVIFRVPVPKNWGIK